MGRGDPDFQNAEGRVSREFVRSGFGVPCCSAAGVRARGRKAGSVICPAPAFRRSMLLAGTCAGAPAHFTLFPVIRLFPAGFTSQTRLRDLWDLGFALLRRNKKYQKKHYVFERTN
jgi:hypothetical protein